MPITKHILEVKIHDVKMNVVISDPTVTASFSTSGDAGALTTPDGKGITSWTTPVGQKSRADSGDGSWFFADAANDFDWDESGSLTLKLLIGKAELG